ncbi:uncharacterized protein GLRG_03944 [Colletotrichum graminicola M1.001]|uniref:Uncharacterized protein n=1 Tax=Colletotrichum graminicola (strain M1.001 / M2 / FGSC 10212) TaxID=645133 RepID=E3QD28_COLGM|nr:uncharacterized protein GLRG_03944 [Colletotrichum graminicola M1.001]EFQ28800.1 hypothetical protein GLRG_03944 [Colletotrichum graminicola M1.001]
MSPSTEIPPATATAAAAVMTGTPASDIAQPATACATAVSRPLTTPAIAVPEGVTVVYAERKRTGRIAGAKYKADGTPYGRSGPAPKPLHERTSYKERAPVKRLERSYTAQRKREVIMFLESHKLPCDDNDTRARRNRADQQPPAEKGYRWPTLSEASEWFKVPEGTIHSWWQKRDNIMGRAPKKPTRAEQRRLAEEVERKRKEDEDRRTQLAAIGWPAEKLPSGTSGTPSTPCASGAVTSGDDGSGEAMECVEGPSRSVPGRQETPEGVPM